MNPRYNVGTNSIPKFPRFVKDDRTCIQFIRVDAQCFFFKISIRLGVFQNMECQSIKSEHPMWFSFNNMHCCISVFFSAFNMFGWCWMAIPKPFLRATRWCGTIRPPCRRCNTSPRRQLSKSSDAQKNWAITLQAWTMMPRNKHVSFFQVVSFFEHGMGFTTCTPKIVLLRC